MPKFTGESTFGEARSESRTVVYKEYRPSEPPTWSQNADRKGVGVENFQLQHLGTENLAQHGPGHENIIITRYTVNTQTHRGERIRALIALGERTFAWKNFGASTSARIDVGERMFAVKAVGERTSAQAALGLRIDGVNALGLSINV